MFFRVPRKKQKLLKDPTKNQYEIHISPLVFENTQPYIEERERLKGDREKLNALIIK